MDADYIPLREAYDILLAFIDPAEARRKLIGYFRAGGISARASKWRRSAHICGPDLKPRKLLIALKEYELKFPTGRLGSDVVTRSIEDLAAAGFVQSAAPNVELHKAISSSFWRGWHDSPSSAWWMNPDDAAHLGDVSTEQDWVSGRFATIKAVSVADLPSALASGLKGHDGEAVAWVEETAEGVVIDRIRWAALFGLSTPEEPRAQMSRFPVRPASEDLAIEAGEEGVFLHPRSAVELTRQVYSAKERCVDIAGVEAANDRFDSGSGEYAAAQITRDIPANERAFDDKLGPVREWLCKAFAADPDKRRAKPWFIERALLEFPDLSERKFKNLVWPGPAGAAGRSRGGAKKKS